ncbi:nitrogen fixation protein NifQ [Aquitalea sp. LB_tupeE]|uniref:nitrogen fixation protein NifQ n=1 Tax=Aquitalea sp. LB_tupeE TaxID=2748078 RepID=UPI0015C14F3B|nr:nitrogen fixation protein NifQ [Aquitalea sp. LB_tupeE]NWK79644.1 nitrogen fixation protein NifQ [Aquitalea sp. LB_tupeE]
MDEVQQQAFRLLTRAVLGVLRNAQDGELPLFAWTLGLPQADLLEVLYACAPELGHMEALPDVQYQQLLSQRPPLHQALLDMLLTNRSAAENAQHGRWLAHALAVASLGSRYLWQDLGLSSHRELKQLLQFYLYPLFARNQADIKWKRFLYAELGEQLGHPGLKPPECGRDHRHAACLPVLPGQQR